MHAFTFPMLTFLVSVDSGFQGIDEAGYPQQLWLRLSGCLSDARNEKLTLQNSLLLRPGVFTTPLFHFYICISGKSSV
ncbi:hypothetical protein EB657_15310 [Escherichia coli]|nr:hypothetical protein [Escherichia coli]MGP76105.1 hypothetical protein [Escherichia coli]